ncbi:unnamed protein product [Tuber aestivum]|uniref:DnaJ homolog 1, mitochondrial n=1 Tax=Tuber aestivum TaxID=59557 RepID=A0A292PSR9_9PEZI|nr:unnamed protein product [Tuber aestivum]
MSFIPPVLPRAARALRASSNPIANFRCFHTPTLSRPLLALRNSNYSQRRPFHSTPRSQAAVKNPYSILGVGKTASTSEIKKSYYSLAKKWHPDQNKDPSARERFQEVQAAYEILSDPAKKEQFDQYGEAAFDPDSGFSPGAGAGPGQGGFSGFSGGFTADFSFEDLFGSFGRSGGGRGSRGFTDDTMLGDNIEIEVTISFMEAASGTSKDIRIHPLVQCKACSGMGVKPGTMKKQCSLCYGTGTRVHHMQGFQMASTCERCRGTGTVTPRGSECGTCSGSGVTKEARTITIDIPAGVDTGMKMRVDGEGDAPQANIHSSSPSGKKRGNLFVHIRVTPHKEFSRKGSDIYYTATIPFTTALLGGQTKIPTLDGHVDIKVPMGTNTGDMIAISGKGMPGPNSPGRIGDLKVEFKLNPPRTLTPRQRILLEMLADEFKDKNARRIMNVNSKNDGASYYEEHKNEGFLKRAWHNLTHQHDDMPKDDDDQNKKASGSG